MDVPYRHRATPALQRLVEYAPSTGGLALWVHHEDVPAADEGPGTPPVATDGHTLFYGRAFDRLPLPEQAGCVAHGVLHVALRHPQRYTDLQRAVGDVDLALFNTCADAIVNSSLGHLGWLALPAGSVRLEALLKAALDEDVPVDRALAQWNVERLYRAIDDRRPSPRQGRGPARGQPAGSSPEGGRTDGRTDGPRAARVRALGRQAPRDLCPGGGAGERAGADAPESAADQEREWQARLLRAHADDGEFSMLRGLIADLPRTRTPWEQVLRVQLARALAPQPALSWSRPSRSCLAQQGRSGPGRRMPFEPGRTATRAVPRLAVVVDVSGSIDAPLMERFAGEVESLARRLGAGLVLIVGDDRVRAVTVFEPGRVDLAGIACQGGGGTDFTPLLEEAHRHGPDLAVVLTDLDGPVRFRPPWPVLWAVPPSHEAAVPPFGRKLVLG